MRQITIAILLLLTLNCFGQSKEKFINSVYLTFVDTSFTKYYLNLDCHPIKLNRNDSNILIKEFSGIAPIPIIIDLIKKSNNDTASLSWICKELDLAKCVNNFDSILLTCYIISVDSKWNIRKQKREEERQKFEQEREYNQKARQERVIYSFSRPIFDNKGEYAIIEMWSMWGITYGQGCIFLFKQENGQWTKLAETNCKDS